MPTTTFFNLPEEKRSRIVEAAIEEFADNSLDKANVTRIVEAADIPRGSFYQYFDDLLDAYRYVLHLGAEAKMEYIHRYLDEVEDSVNLMRGLYEAGWRYAADHPRLAAAGVQFFRADRDLRQEIFEDLDEQGIHFYREIIRRGQDRGDINRQLDPGTAGLVLYLLNNAVLSHYLDYPDEGEEPWRRDGQLGRMLDGVLDVLELGLRPRVDEQPGSGPARRGEETCST